jgi:hypothetical protein
MEDTNPKPPEIYCPKKNFATEPKRSTKSDRFEAGVNPGLLSVISRPRSGRRAIHAIQYRVASGNPIDSVFVPFVDV